MSDTANSYRLYCSPFATESIKVQAAFRYKSVELEHIDPSSSALQVLILKHTGGYDNSLMLTPTDKSLCDSVLMLADLDNNFDEFSIYPDTPVQRFLCDFIELYADTFLDLTIASSSKSFERNHVPAQRDLSMVSADSRFQTLQSQYKKQLKKSLSIGKKQFIYFKSHLSTVFASLNKHFQFQEYLFGNRPSAADFALYGQIQIFRRCEKLNGHGSAFDSWQYLVSWMERLNNQTPLGGEWLLDDYVSDTLWDVFSYLDKFPVDYYLANDKAFNDWSSSVRANVDLPDFIGEHKLYLNGSEFLVATDTSLAWRLALLRERWFKSSDKSSFSDVLGNSKIGGLLNKSVEYQIDARNSKNLRLVVR